MQPTDYHTTQHPFGARPHRPRKTRRKTFFIILAILIVLVLAALVVFQQIKLQQSTASEDTARRIRDQVAKIMILPEEEPLVSAVSNAEELKAQPFFRSVENEDQVLVFTNTAKIVVYRPSSNQIVNAGPIVDDTLPTEAE